MLLIIFVCSNTLCLIDSSLCMTHLWWIYIYICENIYIFNVYRVWTVSGLCIYLKIAAKKKTKYILTSNCIETSCWTQTRGSACTLYERPADRATIIIMVVSSSSVIVMEAEVYCVSSPLCPQIYISVSLLCSLMCCSWSVLQVGRSDHRSRAEARPDKVHLNGTIGSGSCDFYGCSSSLP